MNQNINYTGTVILEVTDHDTGEKRVITTNNVFTIGGQYTLLNAIVRDQKHEIAQAIFGDGSAAKAITNTIGTFANAFTTSIQAFAAPATPTTSGMTLSASWNLRSIDYNGFTISEVGLVAQDVLSLETVLFCRITLDASDQIAKTSNISVNGSWFITVTESAA